MGLARTLYCVQAFPRIHSPEVGKEADSRTAVRSVSSGFQEWVHSLTQHVFIEHLLCAEPCLKHWGYSNEQKFKNSCPVMELILAMRAEKKKINK